jgi:hypothetical protein
MRVTESSIGLKASFPRHQLIEGRIAAQRREPFVGSVNHREILVTP